MLTHPEALLGYRFWILDGDKLMSIGKGVGHVERINKAQCGCKGEFHKSIYQGQCGLYAYYKRPSRWALFCSWQIQGLVAASGDVALYPEGFKAERMQILCFERPPIYNLYLRSNIKKVSKRYGVAIKSKSQIEKMASEIEESQLAHRRPTTESIIKPFYRSLKLTVGSTALLFAGITGFFLGIVSVVALVLMALFLQIQLLLLLRSIIHLEL